MTISKRSYMRKTIILLPVMVTIICLLIGLVNGSRVDDVFMMKIAESFRTNSHSEQLMFISEIYGFLLKFLYNLIPAVSWYWVLQVAILTLAFVCMYMIVTRYEYDYIIFCILVLLQCYFLAFLNFTSTAFLCAGVGVIWYLSCVDKICKKNIKHIVISFLLLLLGFSMRYGSVYFCIILMFVPIFVLNIKQKKATLSAMLLLVLLCTCSNYLCIGIHRMYNEHIPSSMYYNEFQSVRSNASDGGLFEYDQTLDTVGISQNDFDIFQKYVYADINVYNYGSVKTIGEARSLENRYTLNISDFFKDFASQTKRFYVFLLLYFVLFSYIVARKRESYLSVIAFSAYVFGAVGFLFFRRRAVLDIVLAIITVGMFYLLTIISRKKFFTPKKNITKIIIIGLCICSICFQGVFLFKANNDFTTEHDITTVEEYVSSNPDKIYVCDPFCNNQYEQQKQNHNLLKADYQTSHLYSILGDWYIYSYYWYDLYQNLGVSEYAQNGMLLLLDDRVSLATKSIKPTMVVTYFLENYNIKVEYTIEKTFDDCNIVIYDFDIVN